MIKKELIPSEALLGLTLAIESEAVMAVREGKEECAFEYDKDGWYFSGTATLFTRAEDESFSHEYGTEARSSLEYRGIDEIDMETCLYCVTDEDGCTQDEIEVEMDYDRLYKIDSDRNVDHVYDEIAKRALDKIINSLTPAI